MRIYCLPDFPHRPFPWAPRSCGPLDCSHHQSAHYHCGRAWNYQRGPVSLRKQRGSHETRSGPCWNPIIKIFLLNADTMRENPNDFTARFYFSLTESQNPFSKKGISSMRSRGYWKREVHGCVGEAEKREELDYKRSHKKREQFAKR